MAPIKQNMNLGRKLIHIEGILIAIKQSELNCFLVYVKVKDIILMIQELSN